MVNYAKVLAENIRRFAGTKTPYAISKDSGVSQAAISRVLNEERSPTLDTIVEIAKALKVKPSQLIEEEQSSTIPSDILEKLEGKSSVVYETIRTLLEAMEFTQKNNQSS